MYIHAHHQKTTSHGFTLVEMMVAMVIALILLAGAVGIFISEQKSADMILNKTDRLSDLFLASQLMQTALRDAQKICWDDANKRIVYQPLDSLVAVTSSCGTADPHNGVFRFLLATASKTASICWNRPNKADGCQELVRNLKDVTGMQVTPASNANLKVLRKITLTALSPGKDISLGFDVWPRN